MDNQEGDLKTEPTKGFEKLKNYFNDLIKSNSFDNRIKEIRKKYNISIGSEYTFWEFGSMSMPEGFEKSRDFKTKTALMLDIYNLCQDVGLVGLDWFGTILHYIFAGKVIIDTPELFPQRSYNVCTLKDARDEWIDDEEYPVFGKIRHYAQEMETLKYPLAILISPYASQKDILDFLAKNDKTIKELQEKYKKTGIKIGSVKKGGKKARNEFIYKNRDLTINETKVLVEERYGESLPYEYIAKIRSDQKKKRKKM
jgi:hypothetical protein